MNISGSKNQPVSEICTVREKSSDVIASENPYSGIVEVRTYIVESTNANTSDLLLETIERDNHCQTFENLQIDEDSLVERQSKRAKLTPNLFFFKFFLTSFCYHLSDRTCEKSQKFFVQDNNLPSNIKSTNFRPVFASFDCLPTSEYLF